MRIAILGNPDGWYVQDLIRAAPSVQFEVLSFRSLSVAPNGVGDYQVCANLANDELQRRILAGPGSDFDAVIVRCMPLGSLEQIIFRMNALHAAVRLGLRCINHPRCLEIAIDKWLTLDSLRQIGMTTPQTVCCQSRDFAMHSFEQLGGDCVVKPIFGGEGRGIVRITDRDMAWRVFSTLEQLQAVHYIQEFLPHPGYDIRLLVIGERVLSVRRYSDGDWRTNLSQGGNAESHQPTPRQLEMAFQATQHLGSTILGVDILPTTDGRDVLLEVNAVPGWRGTARALQLDVAKLLVEELHRCIQDDSMWPSAS